MLLSITSITALEFWLYHYIPFQFDMKSLSKLPSLNQLTTGKKEIMEYAHIYNFSLPFHIAVPTAAAKRNCNAVISHVLRKKLPPGSFKLLDDDIIISSPEFCLAQVASLYSFAKLVLIINILCSPYIINANSVYHQSERKAVTNLASIKKYAERDTSVKGCNLLLRATKYALENSFSPMESKLAVLMMLPFSRGGYAIKPPKLNVTIQLSAKAAKVLGRKTCCCDAVWEEEKVILEYDSYMTHLNKQQHDYDKRKYNALTMDGYRVIPVSFEQINNFNKTDDFFCMVRRELGMRAKTAELMKYENLRRETVHEILYSGSRLLP